MRLKLRNIFLVYFLVSIVGLLYALLQLGQPCDCTHHLRPASDVHGREQHSADLHKALKGHSDQLPVIYVVTPTYT
ncbi:hypothetical protein FKM82_026720, partial [Ascaphus truei]